MATMVATEEFPLKGHVSPKAAAPAVIKSNKLEGGVQSISRDTTSAVRRFSELLLFSVILIVAQFFNSLCHSNLPSSVAVELRAKARRVQPTSCPRRRSLAVRASRA